MKGWETHKRSVVMTKCLTGEDSGTSVRHAAMMDTRHHLCVRTHRMCITKGQMNSSEKKH